jgi:DNA-binding response OmpR family regulator
MSEDGGRVLVVEHDPGVAELQRLYLTRAGFEVQIEGDPAKAPAVAALSHPDVVVLDLSLSAPAPADLFRRVSEAVRPVPVVCVLAAGATSPGPAEHRITRPFSPRLLVTAVSEALRGGDGDATDLLRVGEVVLDPQTRSVAVGGRPTALTATEFDLLAFLMANLGRVFSREQLLDAAWQGITSSGVRTVDVHIAQLRAKLGEGSPIIRTVRGVGYAADA